MRGTLRRSLVVVVVMLLSGCSVFSHKRPASAVLLCEQLASRYFGANSGLACTPVTDPAALTVLQAVEGAALNTPGGKVEDAKLFVAYTRREAPQTLTGLLEHMVKQFTFVLPALQARNDRAEVSVWVVRGAVGADAFAKLEKDIAALDPVE